LAVVHRDLIVALATRHKLPSVSYERFSSSTTNAAYAVAASTIKFTISVIAIRGGSY
jgi:hypothetical protein